MNKDDEYWNKPRYLTFNEERFGVFEELESFYLFDKVTYGLFKISPAMARFLANFGKHKLEDVQKLMKPELFSDLFKKDILINS